MGEATEVALRVLAEKVGLPGYADLPASLEQLSKRERATFCNDFWQKEQHRVRSAYPAVRHGPSWPEKISVSLELQWHTTGQRHSAEGMKTLV